MQMRKEEKIQAMVVGAALALVYLALIFGLAHL